MLTEAESMEGVEQESKDILFLFSSFISIFFAQ